MRVGDTEIRNSGCEKMLELKIVSILNFNEHLDWILKKAGRKVNALARVALYMKINKRYLLMNSFFMSQFSDCPLV